MAKSIMSHRVTRGSLVHVVGGVGFPNLLGALCAWSAIVASQEQRDRHRRLLLRPRGSVASLEGNAS